MSAGRRDAIVAAARAWIGTPYLHQASLRHVGCDCLGLVRGVWRDAIGAEPEETPPYSIDWAEALGAENLLQAAERHFRRVDLAQFQRGDVLLFRFLPHLPAKHLGVATTREHIVHAHDGACVVEAPIAPQWRRRIVAAFAFPGVDS